MSRPGDPAIPESAKLPYAGRFMYHCHILEHEDHDMMRPIVVTSGEVMDFMSMPGMNGTDPRM